MRVSRWALVLGDDEQRHAAHGGGGLGVAQDVKRGGWLDACPRAVRAHRPRLLACFPPRATGAAKHQLAASASAECCEKNSAPSSVSTKRRALLALAAGDSDRVSVTRAAHQQGVGMLGLNMCDGLTMKAGSAACPRVARMRSLSCAIAISRAQAGASSRPPYARRPASIR